MNYNINGVAIKILVIDKDNARYMGMEDYKA
jgi:hypothetical protein